MIIELVAIGVSFVSFVTVAALRYAALMDKRDREEVDRELEAERHPERVRPVKRSPHDIAHTRRLLKDQLQFWTKKREDAPYASSEQRLAEKRCEEVLQAMAALDIEEAS